MAKSKKLPNIETIKTYFGLITVNKERSQNKYKKVKFTKNGLIYTK